MVYFTIFFVGVICEVAIVDEIVFWRYSHGIKMFFNPQKKEANMPSSYVATVVNEKKDVSYEEYLKNSNNAQALFEMIYDFLDLRKSSLEIEI